jgi:loricrin
LGSHSSGGGGFSSFGSSGHSSGGYSSGHSSGGFSSGHGSGYQQVAIGHSGSEGLHIDQQLLHKIKEVLIQQENVNGGGHGGHSGGFGGGHGGISSSYGPPMQQYGPPGYSSARIVGIDFGHVQQGHQVAQYLKHEHQSFGGGYAPSSSYGAPAISSSYSAPSFISRPSSSYGAPAISRPSSNYGAPF